MKKLLWTAALSAVVLTGLTASTCDDSVDEAEEEEELIQEDTNAND
jgi:hypothetical protein